MYKIIDTSIIGNTFSEKSWKWVYNVEYGHCLHCSDKTKFLDFRRGYAKFCSTKCTANSKVILDKKQKTIYEKYGVTHYSSTIEYKKKFKDTCLSRYGVTNPGQIIELKSKRSRAKQLTFYNQLLVQISEFSTPTFNFNEYTNVRDKELVWECNSCAKTFQANIFGKLPKCPICYPPGNFGGQSSIEKDLLFEIQQFYTGEIIENTRTIISPKELDLYFPDKKFAIEVNGIYWHSDERLQDPYYHNNKFQMCNTSGITLLMITDHEWKTKKDLIIRMIKHRLGLSLKISGRLCKIRSIEHSAAKLFFEENHIHGHTKSTKYYGLFHKVDHSLVAVCSCMKSSRFNKHNANIEITRLAFANRMVHGALGKFIKIIHKEFPNADITTYADLRYGSGNVYLKNGFKETHITKPGYWYFLNNILYHRLSWTKKKLIKLGYDHTKSEQTIMCDQIGALKIYDCGHKHFILKGNIENE